MYFLHESLIPLGEISHDLSLTQVSRHEHPNCHQSWAVNTTSWLLELARILEEDGDDEIAIAVYRKLAERVIPTDHELSELNRTSLVDRKVELSELNRTSHPLLD
jgi:hypothetical protein